MAQAAVYPFYNLGPTDNNVYVIADLEAKRAALVDTSMQSHTLLDYFQRSGTTLEYIINTHGHSDHTFNNAYFKESTGAKLLIHRGDLPMLERQGQRVNFDGMAATPSPPPDGFLEDGQIITVGAVEIQVLHTPGHTPGSCCLYVLGVVMTGDTLFSGNIGGSQGEGGSGPDLIRGVKSKVFVLPDETVVYPGHGQPSTVGDEKAYNPFFQPGAERYLGFNV